MDMRRLWDAQSSAIRLSSNTLLSLLLLMSRCRVWATWSTAVSSSFAWPSLASQVRLLLLLALACIITALHCSPNMAHPMCNQYSLGSGAMTI